MTVVISIVTDMFSAGAMAIDIILAPGTKIQSQHSHAQQTFNGCCMAYGLDIHSLITKWQQPKAIGNAKITFEKARERIKTENSARAYIPSMQEN